VRVVDHDVKPGVQLDMGDGDAWPQIRERLDAELSETGANGQPVVSGKVALAAVVGNEDGAHHISAVLFQGLNDVGFSIPAQGVTYWNGEAMHSTDFKDLDQTPEGTASATATAAANAAHLARLLSGHSYPPVK
jgi:hypothetical protein